MSDHNQEGEHSRENEQPRTDNDKYYYQNKPDGNLEEITQEDIRDARNSKGFWKTMEILMQEEKEIYLL